MTDEDVDALLLHCRQLHEAALEIRAVMSGRRGFRAVAADKHAKAAFAEFLAGTVRVTEQTQAVVQYLRHGRAAPDEGII